MEQRNSALDLLTENSKELEEFSYGFAQVINSRIECLHRNLLTNNKVVNTTQRAMAGHKGLHN